MKSEWIERKAVKLVIYSSTVNHSFSEAAAHHITSHSSRYSTVSLFSSQNQSGLHYYTTSKEKEEITAENKKKRVRHAK